MFDGDEHFHDGWLDGKQESKPKFNVEVEKTIETEKDKEDALEQDDVDGHGENGDNAENESEAEQETSNQEESDEESNYSDLELSLSDTAEFERMSALGYLKQKDITMLLKIRKRENNENQKKKMKK